MWAESQQGWHPTQTPNGPLKYIDKKQVARLTLKQGTPRAPGSNHPHVEVRNPKNIRIYLQGKPVTRKVEIIILLSIGTFNNGTLKLLAVAGI